MPTVPMQSRGARDARVAAAALAFCAAFAAYAAADSDAGPHPPCGGAPVPAYAAAGEDATLADWSSLEWRAPACLAWPDGRYRFLIAVSGRIEAAGAEELRRRLGAVSTSVGLRYWSVTESAWRVLIKDAAALSGPQGDRRGDFAPAEMHAGAVLHFVEEDNRSSEPVTYRMRVLEATPGRIVVETENLTPIKAFLATLFPPGALRAAYIMTRIDDRTWGFYAISAATDRASGLVSLGKESYANRARALFGHFAAPS